MNSDHDEQELLCVLLSNSEEGGDVMLLVCST